MIDDILNALVFLNCLKEMQCQVVMYIYPKEDYLLIKSIMQ